MSLPTQFASPEEQIGVFAHFVTWFKTPAHSGRWEMWKSEYEQTPHDPDTVFFNGNRDIAATGYPLSGVYDSSDPDAIEYQFLLMKIAGIDGIVVDWDGRRINPYRHEAFMELVPHLDRYGLKLIVCFEEWCGYWPPGTYACRGDEMKAASDEMEWLMRELAALPCYAVIRGVKPVLVFRKIPGQWFSPAEWAVLSETVRRHGGGLVFDDGAQAEFSDCRAGRFFWVGGFFPHSSHNTLDFCREKYAGFLAGGGRRDSGIVAGAAVPGFDDTPVWGWGTGPRVAPRYGGRRYEQMWEQSIRAGVDFVQIVTWNDWNEGTEIEPSGTHGYQYLELTARYAAACHGGTAPVPDGAFRLPVALYRARKDVRAAMGGDRVVTPLLDAVRDALISRDWNAAETRLAEAVAANHQPGRPHAWSSAP